MYIGNTEISPFIINIFSVYPYVYREHTVDNETIAEIDGLSLCI